VGGGGGSQNRTSMKEVLEILTTEGKKKETGILLSQGVHQLRILESGKRREKSRQTVNVHTDCRDIQK